MDDLIRRSELLNSEVFMCGGNPCEPYFDGYSTALDKVEDVVKNIPAVDAVEVVRCRECIHRPTVSDPDEIGGFNYEFPDERCPCHCEDGWYSWMPADNWFCGNGQRREDGDA